MATVTNRVNTIFSADGTAFHKTVKGVEGAVAGLKGKIAATFGGITLGLIAHSILEFGDSIQTMANNLNVSTDSAQRFAHATRVANIETAAFQKTLGTLDNLMARWKGGSLDSNKIGLLKRLGLSEADFDAKPDELLFKALRNTKDESREEVQGIFEQLGIKNKIAGQIVGNREDILANDVPIVSKSNIAKLDALGDAYSNIIDVTKTALIPAFLGLAQIVVTVADQMLSVSRMLEGPLTKLGSLAFNLSVGQLKNQSDIVETLLAKLGFTPDKDSKTPLSDWINNVKKELQSLNVKLAAGPAPGDADFIGPVQPEKTSREAIPLLKKSFVNNIGPLETNQFMKIGGFMGADIQYRLSRLAEESNAYLARIATATEVIASKAEDTTDSQEFAS